MRANRTRHPHLRLAGISIAVTLLLAACSGPDDFGSALPTQSPVATETSVPTPTSAPEPTPTEEPTATIEPTTETSPTAESEPEMSPTVDVEPTVESEPTAESTPEPAPPAETPSAEASLPSLEEVGEGGYMLVDQGERTDQQLAQAYMDSAGHLERLEEWGFQQHVFREFTRNDSEQAEPPRYILATVNVYGSPEQADMALQWLQGFQTNQGAGVADTPQIGDASVALTVRTSQGEDTASVYVRLGDRTYIYYGQGANPLPKVLEVANRVIERLQGTGDIALSSWR